MAREYRDRGYLSKDSALYVYDDTLSKYVLLIPTSDLPEHHGAPATVDKTVLTEHSMTEVEGLQSNDQKTIGFNYHRDNINRVKKFIGKEQRLLEVNPDFTGERYTGTIKIGRQAIEVNGIVKGNLFITVSSSDELPIDDVRDIIANTAIVTTPLNDVTLQETTGSVEITLEGLPEKVTFTAKSSSDEICTASVQTNKLKITGVAEGYAKVTITASASGEASSERTLLVEVPASAE